MQASGARREMRRVDGQIRALAGCKDRFVASQQEWTVESVLPRTSLFLLFLARVSFFFYAFERSLLANNLLYRPIPRWTFRSLLRFLESYAVLSETRINIDTRVIDSFLVDE